MDFAVVSAGWLDHEMAGHENMWFALVATQVLILRLLNITQHSSGWRLLVIEMKNCVNALSVPSFLMMLMIVFTGPLHFWLDKVLA